MAIYKEFMLATVLSEIDKAPYQIVYHSQGNPRPPYGKSCESVLSWVACQSVLNDTTMAY